MLKIEQIPIEELTPYDGNPGIHTEAQIGKLKASIEEYGLVLPVLIDAKNVIIAGHAVFKACKSLGISEVPCVRASHLTEAQTRAYILADNRLAEYSSWDKAKLKVEMLRLRDEYGLELEATGFERREILRLRLDTIDEPKDEDAIPEVSEIVTSRLGDLWYLGDHRLICGNSTDAETVARLLGNSRPHLMVTDPPYGVKYNPEWRSEVRNTQSLRTGRVLNDDRDDWREAWRLFRGDVAYVWHAGLHGMKVAQSLIACGFGLRAQIIWAKSHFALSRGEYHWQHECCWYAVREDDYEDGHDACYYAVKSGSKSHWQGSRSESTLWQISSQGQDASTNHGTQKPVECMRRPMLNNSEPNELIYEPFCGSGTTIIAAQSCRRICYAIELTPEYVDMAVMRYQEYTGQAAILAETGLSFAKVQAKRSAENGR